MTDHTPRHPGPADQSSPGRPPIVQPGRLPSGRYRSGSGSRRRRRLPCTSRTTGRWWLRRPSGTSTWLGRLSRTRSLCAPKSAACHRMSAGQRFRERSLLVRDQRDAFVDLLVLETGKPFVDCRVEVERTLLTLETSAEEVARLHGETVPLDLLPSGDGLMGFWVRKPIGVVVGIAGFNYPLLLASHKIAPALAAGCPVIVKPAPQTPLATLWLVHLVREALVAAGGPASAVQLVTGGVDVGSTLTTDPRIGAVSFTGSAAVGHQIARDAAPTKVLLELGSNSALVVADDADIPSRRRRRSTRWVLRLRPSLHQRPTSNSRRIRPRSLPRRSSTSASTRSSSATRAIRTTRVSALIDDRSTTRVHTWINNAITAGATLATHHPFTHRTPHRGHTSPAGTTRDAQTAGGDAPGIVGPTVLFDLPHGQLAWDEEIFGPVIAIRSVPDIATAFRTVNASRYGLARQCLHLFARDRLRRDRPARGRGSGDQRGARVPLGRDAVRRREGLRYRPRRTPLRHRGTHHHPDGDHPPNTTTVLMNHPADTSPAVPGARAHDGHEVRAQVRLCCIGQSFARGGSGWSDHKVPVGPAWRGDVPLPMPGSTAVGSNGETVARQICHVHQKLPRARVLAVCNRVREVCRRMTLTNDPVPALDTLASLDAITVASLDAIRLASREASMAASRKNGGVGRGVDGGVLDSVAQCGRCRLRRYEL